MLQVLAGQRQSLGQTRHPGALPLKPGHEGDQQHGILRLYSTVGQNTGAVHNASQPVPNPAATSHYNNQPTSVWSPGCLTSQISSPQYQGFNHAANFGESPVGTAGQFLPSNTSLGHNDRHKDYSDKKQQPSEYRAGTYVPKPTYPQDNISSFHSSDCDENEMSPQLSKMLHDISRGRSEKPSPWSIVGRSERHSPQVSGNNTVAMPKNDATERPVKDTTFEKPFSDTIGISSSAVTGLASGKPSSNLKRSTSQILALISKNPESDGSNTTADTPNRPEGKESSQHFVEPFAPENGSSRMSQIQDEQGCKNICVESESFDQVGPDDQGGGIHNENQMLSGNELVRNDQDDNMICDSPCFDINFSPLSQVSLSDGEDPTKVTQQSDSRQSFENLTPLCDKSVPNDVEMCHEGRTDFHGRDPQGPQDNSHGSFSDDTQTQNNDTQIQGHHAQRSSFMSEDTKMSDQSRDLGNVDPQIDRSVVKLVSDMCDNVEKNVEKCETSAAIEVNTGNIQENVNNEALWQERIKPSSQSHERGMGDSGMNARY